MNRCPICFEMDYNCTCMQEKRDAGFTPEELCASCPMETTCKARVDNSAGWIRDEQLIHCISMGFPEYKSDDDFILEACGDILEVSDADLLSLPVSDMLTAIKKEVEEARKG